LATIRRDYAEGIRHAQAILDNDALREDVHRDLMQLFVLSGQRAQALRQFEHCRELLRRELAIQPMRETMTLYQSIAQSAIGSEPVAAPWTPPNVSAYAVPLPTQPVYPSMTADEGMRAYGLIDAARRHLATADSQLQLSLQFLER
jgi:hypothetical protein